MLAPGVTLAHPPEVSLVIEEANPLPAWLLAQAHRAAQDAARPGAGHYEVLSVLLLVTLAGEAVLNSLLEPLVSAEEWSGGTGKARALERRSTADKWLHLSEVLRLSPPLGRGAEPLQAFLATQEARNALVHFKHGRNVRQLVTEFVPMRFEGGSARVQMQELLRQKRRMVAAGEVDEVLHPGSAERYFRSLVALLEPVLAAYPKDSFSTAEVFREALGGSLLFGARDDVLADG